LAADAFSFKPYPFKDGNGRIARVSPNETLVLAQSGVASPTFSSPTFCSIEEWVGDQDCSSAIAGASALSASALPITERFAHYYLSASYVKAV